MTRIPAEGHGAPSKIGIHLRVLLRAVAFGLGAYACIHGLVWLANIIKAFLE